MTERTRISPRAPRLAVAAAAAALLSACAVSPVPGEDGRYAEPIGSAPVIDNATPYTRELRCLAGRLAEAEPEARPRVAVGAIRDYTGKYSEFGGNKVTQGAGLMAISAVAKLGLPLVERYDIALAEQELRLANNNLIADRGDVRLVRAGSIPGSDVFLVGGITELNYNIRSVAGDAFYSSGGIGARLYVLNVAVDLRLVATRTLKVLEVVSYQKQILGREVRAGVFEFFGDALFDVSVEDRALEPMQLAVRAMIEKAAGEMARRLFGLDPGTCAPSSERGATAPHPEGGAPAPPNSNEGD